MIKSFRIVLLAVIAVALAVCASAQTFQPRQQRPEWGIFASGVSKTEQRLVLTATFGGGYEDDLSQAPSIPPPDGEILPTTPLYSGPFGSAGASLKYSVDRKKVYGDAQFGAYGRNYRDMTDPFVGTYSADGNFHLAVGKTGSLSTSAFAGQYLQNLSPFGYSGGGWNTTGVPQAPGDPGAFTTGDTYRGFGGSANYSHNFTERISGYGGYSYYANNSYTGVVTDSHYESQWVNAGIRYAIGKGLGVRAGYGVYLGGFADPNAPNYRTRTIDAGIDYNKSLSISRKGTLNFGTGVSGFLDQFDTIHYYFIGNANFNYQIGRSWSAYASVNRYINYYQTLGQPTLDGWVSVGVNGSINRHVELQTGVSYWQGNSAGTNERVYNSTNAFASTRIGLNRILAVSVNYTYYRYRFDNNVLSVPPGFVRQTDRQVVQANLIAWLPLIAKAPPQSRSSNASR